MKTLEATTCCVVQAAQLPAFLAEHPEFALHLTQKLTRMVRRLTEQVKSLALQDVYGRMVRLLMELSEPVGEERVVREKLTQQDIADRVGSSREMVNRVMKELTTGGYVALRDGRHVILRSCRRRARSAPNVAALRQERHALDRPGRGMVALSWARSGRAGEDDDEERRRGEHSVALTRAVARSSNKDFMTGSGTADATVRV